MSDYSKCTKEELLGIIADMEKEAEEAAKELDAATEDRDFYEEAAVEADEKLTAYMDKLPTPENLYDELRTEALGRMYKHLTLQDLEDIEFIYIKAI